MTGRAASCFALVAMLVTLAAPPTALAQADAIELAGSERLGERLVELTLRTPAVAGETRVRVLLPAGYRRTERRYPVLYLLHGASDDYRAWTDKGDVAAMTAGLPLVVVMPDSGPGGGYVDWYNDGSGGPPMWETYHVRQLVPFIDHRYRTIAARRGRALAGLSMGGGGAMTYAARHPGRFVHAAAFSGAVDTNHFSLAILNTLTAPEVSGDRLTQEVRWRGVNPWDLAENLRGLGLSIRAGNGLPGGPYGGGDPVEMATYEMSAALHERLAALEIDHVWDDYGAGGHTWPYWQRDLRLELPLMMDTFRRPPTRPRPFSFRAIEPRYGAYGWRVEVDRAALEFSRLEVRGTRRFALEGSGEAIVRTPPVLRRRNRFRVTVRSGAGVRRLRLRSTGRGRLRIPVELGPANPQQQYTLAERLEPGTMYRTAIAIRAR